MALPVKRIATALLLLVAALGNAFGADSESGPKSISELWSAIEAVLKQTQTPGVGIAIVSSNKAEWAAGIGKFATCLSPLNPRC